MAMFSAAQSVNRGAGPGLSGGPPYQSMVSSPMGSGGPVPNSMRVHVVPPASAMSASHLHLAPIEEAPQLSNSTASVRVFSPLSMLVPSTAQIEALVRCANLTGSGSQVFPSSTPNNNSSAANDPRRPSLGVLPHLTSSTNKCTSSCDTLPSPALCNSGTQSLLRSTSPQPSANCSPSTKGPLMPLKSNVGNCAPPTSSPATAARGVRVESTRIPRRVSLLSMQMIAAQNAEAESASRGASPPSASSQYLLLPESRRLTLPTISQMPTSSQDLRRLFGPDLKPIRETGAGVVQMPVVTATGDAAAAARGSDAEAAAQTPRRSLTPNAFPFIDRSCEHNQMEVLSKSTCSDGLVDELFPRQPPPLAAISTPACDEGLQMTPFTSRGEEGPGGPTASPSSIIMRPHFVPELPKSAAGTSSTLCCPRCATIFCVGIPYARLEEAESSYQLQSRLMQIQTCPNRSQEMVIQTLSDRRARGVSGSGSGDEDLLGDVEPDERVVINVSGQRSETFLSTLNAFPHTLLGNALRRRKYFDQVHNEYFFDRNRASFDSILYFYQSRGKLRRPMQIPFDIFLEEVKFFELGADVIERFKESEGFIREAPKPMPRVQWKRRIWMLFECPESSLGARIVGVISVLVIIVSIVTFCLETLPVFRNYSNQTAVTQATTAGLGTSPGPGQGPASASGKYHLGYTENIDLLQPFFMIETICIIWFALELILRFMSCPLPLRFFKNLSNAVDLVSIVPYLIQLGTMFFDQGGGGQSQVASLAIIRVVRLVRVFRIFKLSRHSKGLQILGETLKASMRELGLLIFFLIIGVILFASAVYYAEIDDPKTNFESIPDAFWCAAPLPSRYSYIPFSTVQCTHQCT